MRQWLIWLDCSAMRAACSSTATHWDESGLRGLHSLPRACGFRSRRRQRLNCPSSLTVGSIVALVAWQGQDRAMGSWQPAHPTLPLFPAADSGLGTLPPAPSSPRDLRGDQILIRELPPKPESVPPLTSKQSTAISGARQRSTFPSSDRIVLNLTLLFHSYFSGLHIKSSLYILRASPSAIICILCLRSYQINTSVLPYQTVSGLATSRVDFLQPSFTILYKCRRFHE